VSVAGADADRKLGAWAEETEDSPLAASALSIPGMEERPEGCGDWAPLKFCAECGDPRMVQKRCGRRVCPDCWYGWTQNTAENVVSRLAAARLAEPDGMGRRAVHAVISPPEGECSTLAQQERARRRAYRLAEEHGIRGGVVVPHGYRVTAEALEEFGEQEEYSDPWLWLRDEYGEEYREKVYYSPHFHVLGLSRGVEASSPGEDDGWVVKRVRSFEAIRGAGRLAPYEDMAYVTLYVLSHVTFDPNQQKPVTYWYGDLSTQMFEPTEAHSAGLWSAIERRTEEAVTGERAGEMEPLECETDGCRGHILSMREVGRYLSRLDWRENINKKEWRRLRAARDWVIGDQLPPPGLQHPKTPDEAEEALSVLVNEKLEQSH
jgi:hypothetical protein